MTPSQTRLLCLDEEKGRFNNAEKQMFTEMTRLEELHLQKCHVTQPSKQPHIKWGENPTV